jgi:hypothetical protein
MSRFLQLSLIGVMLAYCGGTAALSANEADPVLGTWKLNLAKSKFDPGPAPKSQMRTYAQSQAGTTLTISGVAADGSPFATKATVKYDGKDYPLAGNPNYDTLSMKRINGTTVKTTLLRASKVVGTMMRTVSDHGTVLTVSTKVTDPKGAAHNDVAVFDKQ